MSEIDDWLRDFFKTIEELPKFFGYLIYLILYGLIIVLILGAIVYSVWQYSHFLSSGKLNYFLNTKIGTYLIYAVWTFFIILVIVSAIKKYKRRRNE